MRYNLFFGALVMSAVALAQASVLHLNFVSHNEPKDSLHRSAEFNHNAYWVDQMANLIQSKGAKYNLQTCDGFIDGAIQYQGATTLSTDVLEVLDGMPNVEIDPRYKSYKVGPGKRNYADNAYLLGTCGVSPTHILGGFLYYSTMGPPDWFPYQDTIIGNAYPLAKWQADILYGPGSFPPHQYDLNDFGCWKPDTTDNFYLHNPNRHLWLVGNGCAPVMDSIVNEQEVIDSIQSHVYNIQNGIWPGNRFYTATIMINQSNFGPTLYNQVSKVIDSINISCGTAVVWELITEKFSAFQAWQTATGLDSSQWLCGQMSVGINEISSLQARIFPNPGSGVFTISSSHNIRSVEISDLSGKLLQTFVGQNQDLSFDLSAYPKGLYFVKIVSDDGFFSHKKLMLH